ncbi:Nn.00g011200.m01.CDS01 [Neocucurbitaria sp. VM-36]
MSDSRKPPDMIEDGSTSGSAQKKPENNRRAFSLPPAVSGTLPLHASQINPTRSVSSDLEHEVSLRDAQADERTRQQVASFYTGHNRTHYMAGVVDGGNYWERERERERHQVTVAQVPNAPKYNQALRPIPYKNDPVLQSKYQYAGVPAAHNMVPVQAPRQLGRFYRPFDYRVARRSPSQTPARRAPSPTPAHRAPSQTPARHAPPKTTVLFKHQVNRNRINNMVLPDMALPEKSNLALTFTNLNEARNAVLNRALDWMPPSPDPTIPTTDSQRANYVLRLLLAMRNRNNVLDKDVESKRYNATGQDDMGSGYYYKEEDMEKVCWEIVHIAEELHNRGPNTLSIYDRETLKNVKKDINLTFEERMQCVIKLLCFFKSKCDAFMKGSTLEETVALPLQRLTQALTNRDQNDKRAKIIAAGRKAKDGSAEGTATPDPDNDDDDTNTGAGKEPAETLATPKSEPQNALNVDQDVHMQG